MRARKLTNPCRMGAVQDWGQMESGATPYGLSATSPSKAEGGR